MKSKMRQPWWFGLTAGLALAMMLVVAPAMNARAAEIQSVDQEAETADEETMTALKSIFSAQYYADQNPDLRDRFGYDEVALFQHFWNYGIKEGRVVSPIVDLKAYREANPDLKSFYVDDWKGLLKHFVEYGIYETADGTRPAVGVLFNPVTYLREHPEAELSTGGDLLKVAELFISEGLPAGEWADTSVTDAYNEPVVSGIQKLPVIALTPMESAMQNAMASDAITNVVLPMETDSIDVVEQPTVTPSTPTTPSTPAAPVIPAACTMDHTKLTCGQACSACDYVYPDHSYNENGYCIKCGISQAQVTCNHNFSAGTGTCKICGAADPNYVNHTHDYVDGICTLCGDVNSDHQHDFTNGDCACGEPKPNDNQTVAGGDKGDDDGDDDDANGGDVNDPNQNQNQGGNVGNVDDSNQNQNNPPVVSDDKDKVEGNDAVGDQISDDSLGAKESEELTTIDVDDEGDDESDDEAAEQGDETITVDETFVTTEDAEASETE